MRKDGVRRLFQMDGPLWTYPLLKALALNERTKEPFYQKPNEEEAVKQVCEIFKNISTDFIKSWRMTGFKKFAHFEEASDP